MSRSGALDARTKAAVVPRPARLSGVRANVAPNNEWVMLSISGEAPSTPGSVAPDARESHPGPQANIGHMRLPFRSATALLVLMLLPAPAFAWGFVGHRLIMSRAIDLLPPELKPFFVKHRDEVVVRVVDPDTWRVAGWPENPHPFLDFGVP